MNENITDSLSPDQNQLHVISVAMGMHGMKQRLEIASEAHGRKAGNKSLIIERCYETLYFCVCFSG
jgi:hypothetical protein